MEISDEEDSVDKASFEGAVLRQFFPSASEWNDHRKKTKSFQRRKLLLSKRQKDQVPFFVFKSENDEQPASSTSNESWKSRHVIMASYIGLVLDHLFKKESSNDAQTRSDEEYQTPGDGSNYEEIFEKPRNSRKEDAEAVPDEIPYKSLEGILDELIQYMGSLSFIKHALLGNQPAGDGHVLATLAANPSVRELYEVRAGSFFRRLDLQCKRSLLSRMLDQSLKAGEGWSLALRDLLEVLKLDKDLVAKFDQMIPGLDEWSEGKVQTTQVGTKRKKASFGIFPLL